MGLVGWSGALGRAFVASLQQDGVDQSSDGRLVMEDADDVDVKIDG